MGPVFIVCGGFKRVLSGFLLSFVDVGLLRDYLVGYGILFDVVSCYKNLGSGRLYT